MKILLVYASNELENFRFAEFESLCRLFNRTDLLEQINSQSDWCSPATAATSTSLLTLEINDKSSLQETQKIFEQSVLIKSIHEVLAESSQSMDHLAEQIAQLPNNGWIGSFQITAINVNEHMDMEKKVNSKSASSPTQTEFCLNLELVNRKLEQSEKVKLIEKLLCRHKALESLRVNLKQPNLELTLVAQYHYENKLGRVVQSANFKGRAFYTRLIAPTQRTHIMQHFALSSRPYLGNTSMEPRLAHLMTTLALAASPSSFSPPSSTSLPKLCMDPFAGTASILVAAANRGCAVIGCDLDFKVLHGLGKSTRATEEFRAENDCVWRNFEYYASMSKNDDVGGGFCPPLVDFVVADMALNARMWRMPTQKTTMDDDNSGAGRKEEGGGGFIRPDCIITDPPYGIRESSRKLLMSKHADEEKEKREKLNAERQEQSYAAYFPQKQSYLEHDWLTDLLEFAAQMLPAGGRLVFWLHTPRDPLIERKEERADIKREGLGDGETEKKENSSIPEHDQLRLLHVCEQILNRHSARLLIVMERL